MTSNTISNFILLTAYAKLYADGTKKVLTDSQYADLAQMQETILKLMDWGNR